MNKQMTAADAANEKHKLHLELIQCTKNDNSARKMAESTGKKKNDVRIMYEEACRLSDKLDREMQ